MKRRVSIGDGLVRYRYAYMDGRDEPFFFLSFLFLFFSFFSFPLFPPLLFFFYSLFGSLCEELFSGILKACPMTTASFAKSESAFSLSTAADSLQALYHFLNCLTISQFTYPNHVSRELVLPKSSHSHIFIHPKAPRTFFNRAAVETAAQGPEAVRNLWRKQLR